MLLRLVVFFFLLHGVFSDVTNPCSSNSDCGSTGVECSKPNVDPACTKGVCICSSNYKIVGTACVASQSRALGSSCNTTNTAEEYPYGAKCNGTVICDTPAFTQSNSACTLVLNALHDETCNSAGTPAETCNTTALLICNTGNRKCMCSTTNNIWNNNDKICQNRIFGDACSNNNECDVATYTKAQGGGAVCTSSTCNCGTGFTKVTRKNLAAGSTTLTNFDMCLKNYTENVAKGEKCHIKPEDFSDSGALVCSFSSNLVCLNCPGDTSTTEGICRSFTTTSSVSQKTTGVTGFVVASILLTTFSQFTI